MRTRVPYLALLDNRPIQPQNQLYIMRGWTYRPEQTVIALHDLIAGVEQQECTGPERAFGLSLMEAFIAHERTLLITDQATDLNALEQPMFDLSVHLRRRYDFGKGGWFYLEEFQKGRVPLQGLDVHQKRSRGIRNFRHM